jgi:hypothetical protein
MNARLFNAPHGGDNATGGNTKMQEKKDQPGQGDMGSPQKPLPGDEVGKQGGQGDIGKKGGCGDVGSEKPSQPGTEKKL